MAVLLSSPQASCMMLANSSGGKGLEIYHSKQSKYINTHNVMLWD